MHQVHRLMWQVTFGRIPDGLLVCHHCDNPPCCNPGHLFLGTQSDNARNAVRKGRQVIPTARPVGEDHCRARLTEGAVRDIRRDAGRTSQRRLAAQYGVSRGDVQQALNGATWKHLTNERKEDDGEE